jgi:hypothetical protein
MTAVDRDALTLRASVVRDLEREPLAVYEVLYDANGLFSDRPVSDRLAIAERVIAELVSDAAVILWRGRWIGQKDGREPVRREQVNEILRLWSTWDPEDGEPVVWMELATGT